MKKPIYEALMHQDGSTACGPRAQEEEACVSHGRARKALQGLTGRYPADALPDDTAW